MKRTFAFLFPTLLATSIALTSCVDKNAPDKRDTIEFQAPLNGSQQVPGNSSAGTGTFTGTYNKVTRQLTYQVAYAGITPTSGSIRSIADGNSQVGPIEIPFTNVTASPITGTAQLTQRQENDLIFGNMYVNLETRAFPGGEIRANIRRKPF